MKYSKLMALVAAAALLYTIASAATPKLLEGQSIISPTYEAISDSITATGTVTPRNRLEIRPPVAGRLEQMLVREGDQVSAGQPLATISSTERATLIDAAQSKGAEELAYWQEVYKPIQLVAPMAGTVIVATLQPGQVVATTDPIIALSDRLIVQAQVDEVDVRLIQLGQKASITLDAFPGQPIAATVEHIYYESVVTNNVTVYKVDLNVGEAPAFFRSGMNAQVTFITANKDRALTIPSHAIAYQNGKPTVTVLDEKGRSVVTPIEIGVATNSLVEVTSGLTETSSVVVSSDKLDLGGNSIGKNPFMPQFGGRRSTR